MDSFFLKHLIDVDKANEESILDALDKHGIITFNGIFEIDCFLDLCSKIGPLFNHPDADVNGLTQITHKVDGIDRPGVPGLTDKNLVPHTDRATVADPPFYTSLLCIKTAAHGGDTILADGKEIYDVMKNRFPSELSLLEQPDGAIFGRGSHQYSSAIFNSQGSASKYIRFRYDDIAYFSAEIIQALSVFLTLVYQCQHVFKLDNGQGYIVQNGRWLHGRHSFEGDRLMNRALIDSKFGTMNFGFSVS
ncbi:MULTISPECIES: TauD/TfdA family dioxygenase [Spirosoma]|uniref:TauD/TfdA family dioxygenase n=1 Tax=Spirosoma liriopis TaxID=2937440 RepID=A0ABT0HRU7_9BACT|nr:MULTISPECIES: TauD/TfdA family dioxygenase [Spirosoma]MCK8494901.1 TauD/TfdA family dioxygenase [Spirosoma liriopis]UHG94029.1 TauD/TfdA family dioxygenase [Spirosoma oryzicola]